MLLDNFKEPCSLEELFHLVHCAHAAEEEMGFPLGFRAQVTEVLDAFDFSPREVDKLLRPQLEACLRHAKM